MADGRRLGVLMKIIRTTLLALALTVPGAAQRIPGTGDRGAAAEGFFEIRARVDGEVILQVKGTDITHRVVSGRALQLERSTYSQPIPPAVFGVFELERLDGRGRVELVERPLLSNDYTAIIRVDDDDGGADDYHLRLDWTWNPDDPLRPPRGGTVDGRAGIDLQRAFGSREGYFEFAGRVDHVTAVSISGQRVRSEDFGGQRLRDGRYDWSSPIPAAPVDIELVNVRGRGRVELVETPWEGNGYTAVVRIEDLSGGAADYGFELIWRRR